MIGDNQLPAVCPRVGSIDLLRGTVMVVMALDHARDFFSDTAFKFDPADLTQTTPALFFTRWVTHFCAPVFVFLAGTSAHLWQSRGRTKAELSRFLLTRGLFLVILDPTFIRFSWFWDANWRFTFGQVIWAIGWSMIVLAGLIHLPRWFVGVFAVGMIAAHNLLDGYSPPKDTAWGMAWRVLHVRNLIEPWEGFRFWVMYPLIPWVGVLAAGYALGPMLAPQNGATRGDLTSFAGQSNSRRMLAVGILLCVAFVVLRWTNVYGDPRPWEPQKNALFSLFSFLNCEKYPPSLLFLLMTLGPAIAALVAFDRPLGPIGRWFAVFGRVPMFYYLIHAPIIHLLSGLAIFPRYGVNSFVFDPMNPPADYGFSLPVVYAVWIGVVIGLYFPCRWYAGLKQRRRDWWLSYL